jgi:hypothetical protein
VGVDRRDLFEVRLEQDGIKYAQEKCEPNRPNSPTMSRVANLPRQSVSKRSGASILGKPPSTRKELGAPGEILGA